MNSLKLARLGSARNGWIVKSLLASSLFCSLALSNLTVRGEQIESNGYSLNLIVDNANIKTGIGPFDDNDEAGYDSSETNDIVRTNDDVLYDYQLVVNNPHVAGKNLKVEIKSTINNAVYKNNQGIRFNKGESSFDASTKTLTNIDYINVNAGTAISGIIPVTVTDKFKNGHEFNMDIAVRVIDADSNQPLTDYLTVPTKPLRSSSKMNFGVKSYTALYDNAINSVKYAVGNMKNNTSEMSQQLTANQYIMIYGKSFRKDSSLKGLYIEEGAKINLRLEKVEQNLKYDDESKWYKSPNNLTYEIFGGNIYGYGHTGNDQSRFLLVHPFHLNSFSKDFNYFTENNLPQTDDQLPGNAVSNHNFPIGFKAKGKGRDTLDRNNANNEIFWSGTFNPESRVSPTVVKANIQGYELGNNPVIEEASRYYTSVHFRDIIPISVHTVVTNVENNLTKTTPNNNIRNNTTQTTFAVHLDSYDLDGLNYPVNDLHKSTINKRNIAGSSINASTSWQDLNSYSPHQQPSHGHGTAEVGDRIKTYWGHDKTVASGAAHVIGTPTYLKYHIKWNPEIVTVNEQSAKALDDIENNDTIKKMGSAAGINESAILSRHLSVDDTWKALNPGVPYGNLKLVGFKYDYGVKKNTDYSKNSILNANEDDYIWFETYQELLNANIGEVSAIRREHTNHPLEGWDYVSTPLMTIDSPTKNSNFTNGNPNIEAMDTYYRYDKNEDWQLIPRKDGVETQWSPTLELIKPETPGFRPNSFTTIAIENAEFTIFYNKTDNQPTSNVRYNLNNEAHVSFKIVGKIPNSPDYSENDIQVKVNFPKGILYKQGSAYVVSQATGNKIPINVDTSNDDYTSDRDIMFKLPPFTAQTGTDMELHYDTLADENVIEHNNLIYSTPKQYATLSYSSFKVNERIKEELYEQNPINKTASFTLNHTILKKVSIIDTIDKEYDEINTSHIVNVRPYTNLDTPQKGVTLLTRIPTTTYKGNLKLINVTAANESLPYKVYYTTNDLPSEDPKNLNNSMFTLYTGGEVIAKYVYIELEHDFTNSTKQSFNLHMKTDQNSGGDKYVYQSTLNTSTRYDSPVISNDVSTRIISRNLSGVVWHDRNKNGLIDEQEHLFNNRMVELFKDNNKIAEVKTNNDGVYKFNQLPVGQYEVRLKEFDKSTWIVTTVVNEPLGNKSVNEDGVLKVKDILFEQKPTVDVDESPDHNIGMYQSVFQIDVIKRWKKIDAEATPPVTIELLKNGIVVNQLTLNHNNHYRGSFKDLPIDEKDSYSVREVQIEGFESSQVERATDNNREVIIINKKVWKKLPATGGHMKYVLLASITIIVFGSATYIIKRKHF